MTRVVVQRTVNASNSSQSRQSSSAPQSTTSSVPSSANSSTSSHLPTHPSGLAPSAPCPEGKEGEIVNDSGDDDSNFNSELNNRSVASIGVCEGRANERYQTCAQSESPEKFPLISHSVPEDAWEGRRDGERPPHQLTTSDTSGLFSERVIPVASQDSAKGKELVDDGRCSNFVPVDEGHGGSTSEDSGVVQLRAADNLLSEHSHEDEACTVQRVQNALQRVQHRLHSTLARQYLPSSSLPSSAAPASPPLHNNSYDIAPVHEADQARPNSSQTLPEAVGCSYLDSAAPPPLSSSSSRRGSWLGSSGSAGLPRGGIARRGSRVSKPSRNSPNSSRPSSPRSYGEGDGYNSADEQNSRSPGSTAYENNTLQEEREHQFEVEIRGTNNFVVRRMAEDGNCLFRAVADQVYGDAEMYDETRQLCIDYLEKERDHFSQFVTESFSAYCKRKRRDKVYGNNLEIQAMAEMYNRPIHIYSYSLEPINICHGSYETDLPPIRLSYHRGNHYNSLMDPGRPAVGAGLGFGSLRGTNVDREQVKAALKAQQDQQIDKALLAEGRFYSDIELTDQEIQRMVMEASKAEFFEEEKHRHYAPWSEETSTSAAAEPSSSGTTGSPKSAVRTMSLAATSTTAADSTGLTPNVRMLMSMGFSYIQVMEACSIFGDDVNNMLCYLLETDNTTFGDGESMYRKKGKAAER